MTQWGQKNVIEFYSNNRNKLKHLYDSERIPLNYIRKKKIKSVLDFGCAVGGFYEIFKIFLNKKITYLGLDTEKRIISTAKKKYSKINKVKFDVIKKGKAIKTKKYNLTFCTGVLNHNKNYKKIIINLIKLSNKYSFIDSPRVHFNKDFVGKLNLTKRFPSEIKKNNIVNNYTINYKNYFIFLKKIFKKNKINFAIFYSKNLPYKKKYLKINKKISFLTFLCSKNEKKSKFKLITNNKEMLKVFNNIFN